MSRPAHIAALDAALLEQLAAIDAAEAEVVKVMDLHHKALDEVDAALNARANAFSAARLCEQSIRRLGYVVLDGEKGVLGPNKSHLDGRHYREVADREAARQRAREARPTPQDELDRAARRLADLGVTISVTPAAGARDGFEDRPAGRILDAARRAGIAEDPDPTQEARA